MAGFIETKKNVEKNWSTDMEIRAYRREDIKEIAELFYNAVHTINAADYTDYSGTPAHPGHSSAQPDRTSAHLM